MEMLQGGCKYIDCAFAVAENEGGREMKKGISLLLATMMCASTITGCATSTKTTEAKQETTQAKDEVVAPTAETADTSGSDLNADIVFWSSYTESSNYGQCIAEVADAFMKENPGVNITISFQGTDISTTLGAALQAGTKVTMFEANSDNVVKYWKNNLRDLGEYYAAEYPQTNGKTYAESITPAYEILAREQGDGKYAYFPYTPQFLNIWYNKDIFDACGITEKPKTFDEMMDICEILVENGYTPFTSDQKHIDYNFGYYIQRLLGEEGTYELVHGDGSAWDNPLVLEAAKKFEEAANKGYFADNIMTVVTPEAQQEMVIDRKIAMYVCGSWMPNNVRESAGDDFRWGSFTYPLVENGVDDGSSLCYGCYGIAINKDATKEEADACAAFAVYLTLGEWGDYLVQTCNAIPITNDPNAEWPEMIADARHIYDGITNRWLAHGTMRSNNDFQATYCSAVTKLFGGAISAEEFIAECKGYFK